MLLMSEKMLETYKIPQIEYIGDKLPVNPRKGPWAKRPPDAIKYLVIHHSASTGSIEAENHYHIDHNNWYRLSYHFSIDRGRILQINDVLDVTSHALGANANGIGICVNWDLRLRGLTEFEKSALYALVGTLIEMFPDAEIVGHSEISKRLANHITSCPVISMNQLRSDIVTEQLNLALTDTPNAETAKMFAAYGRFSDLYKLATTDGPNRKEAQRKCLKIADAMVNENILVMK